MDSIEAHEKRNSVFIGEIKLEHLGEVFDMDSRNFPVYSENLRELVEDGDLKFLRVFQIKDWKIGKNKPKLPSIEM